MDSGQRPQRQRTGRLATGLALIRDKCCHLDSTSHLPDVFPDALAKDYGNWDSGSSSLAFCSWVRVRCRPNSRDQSLRSPTATAPLEARVGALELVEGDCIKSTIPEEITIETIVIVPCDGEWQYRVVDSFDAVGESYPSEIEFGRQAFDNCDQHYTFILFPEEEAWSSTLWPHRQVDCLQESFGLSLTDPAKLDRLVGWDSLRIGECLSEAPETADLLVEIVPCNGQWQYRVLNSFDAVGSNYPSEVEFQRQASANCDRHYTYILYPEEIWPDWRVDCLQESFGLSVSDPAKLDRLVSLESLEAGQCFNDAPETDALQVEIVSCTGAWDYQVVDIVPLPEDDSFPGDGYIESRADRDCATNTDYYFYPTYETWAIGDRQILCVSTN